MQPDLIGGRYRVRTAIGQGGMGTVWLCRDETLERDVAVKQVGLLPGESITDSARALREARSSAALSHRNVVTVFDVVEEGGAIWLVMEHVPSRSLSDLIKESGPLHPAEVADIGAQVADGLAAAHAAGTMHRDVKPGNILIRDDGVAKISDFGIARNAKDPTLTQSGFVTGTPSYFSPELARGAAPDPASDVWSLGATLYAAVEGRPPYDPHPNPMAVLHEIATVHPPRPEHADFLEPVLLRMMDRDPRSRWSMADAAHALHRLARRHSPENTQANTIGLAPATIDDRRSKGRSPGRSQGRSLGRSTSAARVAPVPVATTTANRPEPSSRSAQTSAPPPAPARGAEDDTGAPPAGRRFDDGPRRHRGAYAALVALALLLVVGGIAYVVDQSSPDGSRTTAGDRPSGSKKPSASSSKKDSPSSSPSSQSSSSASGSASTSAGASSSVGTSAARSTTPTSKASFLRDYFAIAPGGTDQGWSQLGPGEQAQGRGSYDGFWRGISSVNVLSAHPVKGTSSVDATVVYRRTNGETSTEHKRFDLIRSRSGGWLINGEHSVG